MLKWTIRRVHEGNWSANLPVIYVPGKSEDLSEPLNTLITDMVNWLKPLVHWDRLIGNVKSSGSFAFMMYGVCSSFCPGSTNWHTHSCWAKGLGTLPWICYWPSGLQDAGCSRYLYLQLCNRPNPDAASQRVWRSRGDWLNTWQCWKCVVFITFFPRSAFKWRVRPFCWGFT